MSTASIKERSKGAGSLNEYGVKKSPFTPYLNLLYLIVLFFIFLKGYSYIYDEKLSLGGDNADYYLLGKAIAKGKGYICIESADQHPAYHFPPGYPLIVATVMKVAGFEFMPIKVANGIFLFATAVILFFLAKRYTGNPHLSFVASVFLLLNGTALSFSTYMYSEVPFLFFVLLSFLIFTRIKDYNHFYKDYNFYLVLITSVFAYHIRAIGISLYAGFLLFLLVKRHWKMAAAYAGGIILLSLPWALRNKAIGAKSDYLHELILKNPYQPEHGVAGFTDLVQRVWEGFQRYISKEIPAGIFNVVDIDYNAEVTSPFIYWVYGIIAVVLTAYGLYRLNENRTLFVFFFLGNFGILLLWQGFGTRFMISVIPFFILFICIALKDLADKYLFKRLFNTSLHPLFLLVFVFILIPKVKALRLEAEGVFVPEVNNYLKIAVWAKENTPKDAVISCRKPSLFALYSGRYVTQFAKTLDQNEFIKDLENRKVDYVVLDALGYTSTSRYLYPVIQNNPLMFPMVKHEPGKDTYLLQFNRELEFTGNLVNGKKEGFGKAKYKLGNYYEGEWKDSKMHGKGKLTYPTGHIYEGEWENGIRQGKGLFKWAEGAVYEGDWKNDGRDGYGIFKVPDGSEYRGEWKGDKRNGKGTYIWPDKTTYEGQWVDDKRTGEAWLYLPSGMKYYGTWNQDVLNGLVKIYDKSGKFLETREFRNNQPVQ